MSKHKRRRGNGRGFGRLKERCIETRDFASRFERYSGLASRILGTLEGTDFLRAREIGSELLHKLASDRHHVKRGGGIGANVGVQIELLLRIETAANGENKTRQACELTMRYAHLAS